MPASIHSVIATLTAMALTPCVVSPALGQVRIGGFDASRSVAMSFAEGSLLTTLRASIPGGCRPLVASMTGAPVLTASYLGTLDTVVISCVGDTQHGITPLSSAEQNALYDFVLAGGGLVIFADNDSTYGSSPTSPNGSCVGPFGFTVTGTAGWPDQATLNPGALLAVGPYGTYGDFTTFLGGWISVIPPVGSLATLASNGQVALAVIPAGGSLGP